MKVTGAKVIRSAPDAEYSIVGTAKNTRLPIIGKTGDGIYYQVKYQNQIGWIHRNWGRVEGYLDNVPVIGNN
jgi:uncharacterized protein YgiM (DUF1202 family)